MANLTTCLARDNKRINELSEKFGLTPEVAWRKASTLANNLEINSYPTDEQMAEYLKSQQPKPIVIDLRSINPVDTSESDEQESIEESPIQLNTEQQKAFDDVMAWLENPTADKDYFVIDGKAGTGKTTVAKEIIKAIGTKKNKKGFSPFIIAGAISHKATKVIGKPIQKIAYKMGIKFDSNTVASMLGMKLNEETGKFEPDTSPDAKNIAASADIIIIDEASMITKDQFKTIMQQKNISAKVLFLGDKGQLPPIEEGEEEAEDFIGFSEQDNIAHLYTRMRQGEESPILPYADKFWNSTMHTPQSEEVYDERVADTIQKEGALIAAKNHESIQDNLLSAYKKALESGNFNYIKYICFRNSRRHEINSLIHNTLLGKTEKETGYSDGDFVMLQDSFIRNKRTIITNSEEGIVVKQSPIEYDEFNVPYFDMTIKTDIGEITLPVITRRGQKAYKEQLNELAEKAKKFGKTPSVQRREAWKEFYKYKQKYAAIDFGYAITSHKSQGSTYAISVVDLDDIYSVSKTTAKTKSQSAYTAITRASKAAVVVTANAVRNTAVDINNLVETLESIQQIPQITPVKEEIEESNPEQFFEGMTESETEETNIEFEPEQPRRQADFKITYTPKGKQQQTYIVRGSHIYNKNGKEVFKEDSVDRNKIFANLAVSQGRAVVIEHDTNKYVVNDRNQIISVTTGKIMNWEERDSKRKAILEKAREKFEKLHNSTKQDITSKEETKEIEQIITVAPYFRSILTTDNKEEQEKATQQIKEKAQKLANILGLQIESIETCGGIYLGKPEISYQYRIKSNDQEKVDLFASLMGDLSNEYQDAVIAANYTNDKSQITAYELTWTTPNDTPSTNSWIQSTAKFWTISSSASNSWTKSSN